MNYNGVDITDIVRLYVIRLLLIIASMISIYVIIDNPPNMGIKANAICVLVIIAANIFQFMITRLKIFPECIVLGRKRIKYSEVKVVYSFGLWLSKTLIIRTNGRMSIVFVNTYFDNELSRFKIMVNS